MRWARLLHAHERVEVLAIDAQTRKARICRHGFVQEIPLEKLVLEEESALPTQLPPSAPTDSREGVTLSLHLTAGNPEVTILMRRDGPAPAYLGLYLRAGRNSVWHPIWQEVFTTGAGQFSKISQTDYLPPWIFRLYVLPLVNEPSVRLPEPQVYEATLRPLFFARSGTFPVEWTPLFGLKATRNASDWPAGESAPLSLLSTYDFPRAAEIDLHIEKLAPPLASEPGEVIFQYQKEVLERYLDWAYREKLPEVRVIHGKGDLKLRQLLLKLCERHRWKAEVLMIPPYSGGATKVSF